MSELLMVLRNAVERQLRVALNLSPDDFMHDDAVVALRLLTAAFDDVQQALTERDATIAALQKRIDNYERSDTSHQPYENGWQDGRKDAWQAYSGQRDATIAELRQACAEKQAGIDSLMAHQAELRTINDRVHLDTIAALREEIERYKALEFVRTVGEPPSGETSAQEQKK